MNRSSSSLSSASRWLRRRAAEGIYQPGAVISSNKTQPQSTNDSTEILAIHLQKGSNTNDNNNNNNSNSSLTILQSLPVAVLQIENAMSSSLSTSNPSPPDSLRETFTQNLEACKKSRANFNADADYQKFISKSFVQYLSLLGRILASPSASGIWVKSVSSFSVSLKTAFGGNNANDNKNNSDGTLLFIKLAKRSSPLWVNRWIQICQQEELLLSSSSPSPIDLMTKEHERNTNTTSAKLQRELHQRTKIKNSGTFNNAESRQRRQLLLDCCEQISTSLLPFCNREMLEHLQSSVLDTIEKERQKLVQEEKGVIAVMEQQLLLPSNTDNVESDEKSSNWNLALRTFLVNRDAFSNTAMSSSSSSSSLRNNAADIFVKQSAGKAAIYCFEKIVTSDKNKKNNSNDESNSKSNINTVTNEKYLFYVSPDSSSSASTTAAEFSLSSFLPQVAPKMSPNIAIHKNNQSKSKNNNIFQQQIISDFDSSFRSWSVQNSRVPSLLVYEYCRIAASSSSSSPFPKFETVSATTPMREILIKLVSRTVHVHQRLGLGANGESSTNIDSNNNHANKNTCSITGVAIASTLVQFLAKFLTPFVGFRSNNNHSNGMNTSPLSSAGRTEPNKNNKLHEDESDASSANLRQMLPTLSAISSLLVLGGDSISSISNSQHETLKNTWMIISNALKGNFSPIPIISEKSDSSALSILDKLLSLSANNNNNNNNTHYHHVNNSVEGQLQHLPLIIDTFTVCLLASAIQLNVTQGEIEKSHQYFSNNLFNSHYGSFLLSRAQLLVEAFGKANSIDNQNKKTLRNASHHIDSLHRFLGFTNCASQIAFQILLEKFSKNGRDDEKDMPIDEFLHLHSKLLIENEETLDRIVSSSKSPHPIWKSIWKFEQQQKQGNTSNRHNEEDNKVLKSLLRVSMWREAISIAKPFQVSSLCERILLDSSSSFSPSSSATKWELAVGLLSEIASRNLRLKPFALMTVLRALDNPSAPEEMSVNLAIQLGGGAKSSEASTDPVEEGSNEADVVNLLVSVTRAVLRQKHDETEFTASSSSGAKPTNGQLAVADVDPLLQARVFAISNLLSVQSTSMSMKRKQASSLRSAMLLCAESGDWQSAFFLISSASEKMPEFRLPPDVVWKVTQALEDHGQRARVDLLKDFVASKDVADWLHSDDENLLNEKSIPSFSSSSSSYSSKNQDDMMIDDKNDQSSGVESSSSSSPVLDPRSHLNDINANFALLADFVSIRCNAIHRAASLGRWKVAVSLFANVITAATHQTKKSNNDQILLQSAVIRTPMSRALASLIKVCALRRHWQDALLAMKSFDATFVASPSLTSVVRSNDNYPQQNNNNNNNRSDLCYIPTSQVSSVLIRCLSVYGRWYEATSLFSQSVVPDYFYQIESRGKIRDVNNFNVNDDLKKKQKQLATLFTYLTRACRISAAWSSALRLHNSASTLLLPTHNNNDHNNVAFVSSSSSSVSLTSFSSVSEVVGACSAGGFPLTKIQMWLNLSKSSLFLVAASLKTATSSGHGNDNGDEEDQENGGSDNKPSSSSVLETVVRSPEISMIDLAVFFALLNAQSYYFVNNDSNNNKQKTILQQSQAISHNHLFGNASLAWIRSLQLLNACWFNNNSNNNNNNNEVSSSSRAFFEAAREPECVTSVIDTCARNGNWIEAFQVYSMQKMLLIPVTSYAVYVLLVSLLEQQQQQQQQQLETNTMDKVSRNNSTLSSSKWMMACELVKDLMKLKRTPSTSAPASTAIQPIITEKFVQVLCYDGKWKEGLNLAKKFSSKVTITNNSSSSSLVSSSSMAFLLNNDRVLDVLVKYATENSQVVLQAALKSGSFPVSPFHALGRKVEEAIRDLLFFSAANNNSTNNQEILDNDARSFLLLPINAMSKCLKMRDISEDLLCAARLRGLRVVANTPASEKIFLFGESHSENRNSNSRNNTKFSSSLNNNNNNHKNNSTVIITSENISYWISVCQKYLSDQSTDVSPIQAVDFAFANLVLAGMAMMEAKKLQMSISDVQEDDEHSKRYIAASEDLLRYSMLFGIPSKTELLEDWPLKLTEIIFATTADAQDQEPTGKALLTDVVGKLKNQVMIPLAEEMP